MADPQRPTVRRRHLGMKLRQIREARGLTMTEASEILFRSHSALSKLEAGKRGIRRSGLEHMLNSYGVTNPEFRKHLIRLAEDARTANKHGWWHNYGDALSPETLDYLSLEAEATMIKVFQLHLIPGLLQTEAYARAVIRSFVSLSGTHDEDLLASVRMQRQDIFKRVGPPRFHAIVSEAALRQQVGGPAIMRTQLQHLITTSERGHVQIQVMPFTGGAHPGHNGSFTLLETGAESLTVVLVESLTTGWYLDDDNDIQHYSIVADRLQAMALSTEDSSALILQILSES